MSYQSSFFGDKKINFIKSSENYYIIDNFENTNLKECIKMDLANEKLYTKLISKVGKARRTIKDSGIHVNLNLNVPQLPKPNNTEKYELWKNRKSYKPVIAQSRAILFLKERGYELDIDYEAFQAIELSNEIKRHEGIPIEVADKTKNFDNLYTKEDKNILRNKFLTGNSKFVSNLNRRKSMIQGRHRVQSVRKKENENENQKKQVCLEKPERPKPPENLEYLRERVDSIRRNSSVLNNYQIYPQNEPAVPSAPPPEYTNSDSYSNTNNNTNYRYSRDYTFYKEESLYPKIDDIDIY